VKAYHVGQKTPRGWHYLCNRGGVLPRTGLWTETVLHSTGKTRRGVPTTWVWGRWRRKMNLALAAEVDRNECRSHKKDRNAEPFRGHS